MRSTVHKNLFPVRHRARLCLAIAFLAFPVLARASHAQAPVSDIDYTGMGTFTGSYTQSNTDHVWVIFNAAAGNTITFTLNTSFQQHYWLYRSSSGCVQVGNSSANGCMPLIQDGGNGATNGTYSYTVPSAGQYALQLDAFIGQSGSYSIAISGATVPTQLCSPGFTTCPGNISLNSGAACGSTVSYTATSPGSINYTFSGATTGTGSGTGSGSFFNNGVTNVSLFSPSGCGGTSCSFTVSVTETQVPTITAPGPITLNGICQPVPKASVPLGMPVTGDNCAVASVLNNAPANYPVGATTTVTWTVTDVNGNTAQATQTVTVNAGSITANAAVSPLYPMPGQEIQTIYLGYTPSSAQAATITVSATSGTSPFGYAWTRSGCNNTTFGTVSNSANAYTFTPAIGDLCAGGNDNIFIFNIVVTDANGCASTQTKKINVVNPFASNGDIRICHRNVSRGSVTTQLMEVAPGGVATHLAHGDYLGNCLQFQGGKISLPAEQQNVHVYPNPTQGRFRVELSQVKEQADIVVTDVQGRQISAATIGTDVSPEAFFDLSEFSSGMYLISVKDGEMMYRTKIVLR